jgi:hypothetical protein
MMLTSPVNGWLMGQLTRCSLPDTRNRGICARAPCRGPKAYIQGQSTRTPKDSP